MMKSEHGPRRLEVYETYMRRRYDVACWVGSELTFLWHGKNSPHNDK